MNEEKLLSEIQFCIDQLTNESDKLYEFAFFKIFVKFEKYLSQRFLEYSTGQNTKNDIVLERKLNFANETHLRVFLKSSKQSFIDYFERIKNTSEFIFEDNKDPFSLIFKDAHMSQMIEKMKCLRNYIAHESDESKSKYHKYVITNAKPFIEPNDFLKEINRKTSKTNFTLYIDDLKEMIKRVEEPELYFRE